MARITANASAIATKWRKEVYRVRKNLSPFGRFEGRSESMPIIEVRERLTDARSMRYTIVEKLRRRGLGITRMVGNEEVLPNKTADVYPHWLQNATVVRIDDAQEASFDLYAEQRPALNEWLKDEDMTRTIEAMFSVANSTARWEADPTRGSSRTVPYWAATTAQADAWLAANYHRALFGAAQRTSGTFAQALASVASNAVMSADVLRNAVSLAKLTNWERGLYPMHPYRDEGYNREYFVVLHDSASWFNLKKDAEIQGFHRDAMFRIGAEEQPYFKGGEIIYEQTINIHCPEFVAYTQDKLLGLGASSANLCGAVMLGRQAIVKAVGQPAEPTRRNEDDYGQFRGVGIRALDTYEKIFYAGAQYGLLNIFTGIGTATVMTAPLNPAGAPIGDYDGVAGTNALPQLTTNLLDQTVAGGGSLSYQFAVTTFSDPGDGLTYSAAQADGSALPGWISFNAGTRTFSGTAPAATASAQVWQIRVTATDSRGGTASDIFAVTVPAA